MNRAPVCLSILWMVSGCTFVPPEPEPAPIEPINLSENAEDFGMPVGIRTVTFEEQTFEVWYPLSEEFEQVGAASIPVDEFIPQSVTDLLGDVSLAPIVSNAVRDAPPRPIPEPLPVLLFSHGFGGFRTQSNSLCTHLASRGFIVVAPDHPGRMLGDVLPCVFEPALEGCDLAAIGGSDVAIDDLLAARRYVQGSVDDPDSFLRGMANPEALGIFGHSAGGGSAMELGGLDPSFRAILSMAAGASTGANKPTAIIGGACDAFADPAAMGESLEQLTDGLWVNLLDSGHMPFSDICALDLGGLADDVLMDRPDVNPTFLNQLLALATSGCPGYEPSPEPICGDEYLGIEEAHLIIRHYTTRFFDLTLRDRGVPIVDGGFEKAEVFR